MSIVTSAQLAAYLRISETDEQGRAKAGLQAALDAAEALVAAELDTEALEVRAVTHSLTIPRATRFALLPEGPLVSLQSATLDGAALDFTKIQTDSWMLAYPVGFAAGQTLELTYAIGWDAANLPQRVRQAIYLAGAMLFNRTDQTVTSLGVNDASFSGENTAIGRGALPVAARDLLRAWRNPHV